MDKQTQQFVLANELAAPRETIEIDTDFGPALVNMPTNREQCRNGIREEFATLQTYEHITAEALLNAVTRLRVFLLAYRTRFGSLSAEQEPLIRF